MFKIRIEFHYARLNGRKKVSFRFRENRVFRIGVTRAREILEILGEFEGSARFKQILGQNLTFFSND